MTFCSQFYGKTCTFLRRQQGTSPSLWFTNVTTNYAYLIKLIDAHLPLAAAWNQTDLVSSDLWCFFKLLNTLYKSRCSWSCVLAGVMLVVRDVEMICSLLPVVMSHENEKHAGREAWRNSHLPVWLGEGSLQHWGALCSEETISKSPQSKQMLIVKTCMKMISVLYISPVCLVCRYEDRMWGQPVSVWKRPLHPSHLAVWRRRRLHWWQWRKLLWWENNQTWSDTTLTHWAQRMGCWQQMRCWTVHVK